MIISMRFLFAAVGVAAASILFSYFTVSRLEGQLASFGEAGALLSSSFTDTEFSQGGVSRVPIMEIPLYKAAATSSVQEIVFSPPALSPKQNHPTSSLLLPPSPAPRGVASSLPPPPPPPSPPSSMRMAQCDFGYKDPTHLALLNEIAWMGSPLRGEDEGGGPQAEWIELKNNSGGILRLAGWQLLDSAGKFKVRFGEEDEFSGNRFYLLERGDDETVPNVAANAIYTGTLPNAGAWLRLFDARCELVDEIDASHSWPAGNNDSKRTMERSAVDLSWHTSANPGGTPSEENSTMYERSTPPLVTASVDSPQTIPHFSESPSSSFSGSASTSSSMLININSASLEELDRITGVGSIIAQRIIDYRNQYGPFQAIEDIKNVSGIGDVTFEKMKGEITVGDVVSSTVAVAASSETFATSSVASSSIAATTPAKININTASYEELQKITGVGPTIAQRIIDYRQANGPFQTIEDIEKVKGIGDVTFNKMKDQITI